VSPRTLLLVALAVLAVVVAAAVIAAVVWTPWIAVGVGAMLVVMGLAVLGMRYGARRAKRSSVWDDPR